MSIERDAKSFFLQQADETEFDVTNGAFENLEIRPAADETFHYFYDKSAHRLIKSFVLRRGPKVDTMCDVFLIKKNSGFTPRLTFWKKDKSTGWPDRLTEEVPATDLRTVLIKARVDLSDCHDNLWKLIDFLQACKDIELPDQVFRIADRTEADLAKALEGRDKDEVLTAVKTYLAGEITERDVQMLAYYRCYSPRHVPLATLVKTAGIRWTTEENFQASKGLTGLDEHQVRTWTAWHRWVTLAMLALAFLTVASITEHAGRPPPPAMIPLTRNEIAHLTAAIIIQPARARHRLRWSAWRRRHQHRARTCHYNHQADHDP